MSHVGDGESEQDTSDVSPFADYLRVGKLPLTAGDRSIRAKKSTAAGPLTFEVQDADGDRTCSNVRELPIWAVRVLIGDYSEESQVDDRAFTDPYDWLEVLLASQKRSGRGRRMLGTGHGKIAVISTEGPSTYVVTDGDVEHEYANLNEVPDLDQFQPALLEAAERERENLRRRERQKAVQKRLDEMINASEALSRSQSHSSTSAIYAPVSVGAELTDSTSATSASIPPGTAARTTTPVAKASSADQSSTIASSNTEAPHETLSSPGAGVSSENATPDPETPVAERAQLVTNALSGAVKVLNDIEAEVRARTAVARRLAVEEKAHRARTDEAAAIASATEAQNQAITEYISRMLAVRTAELEARESTIEDRLSRVQIEARERERSARNRDLLLAVPGAFIIGIAAILVMHFVFHIG